MKKITSLEYNTLIWFIIRAGFVELTVNSILEISGQDSWISIIIGLIIGLIPFTIYEIIKNKYPEDNYISLNQKLFKKTGNILNFIILLGCLLATTCTFWVLVRFANSLFLYKTNALIISIAFIIPIYYTSTKGMHVISKVSLILFYICIFLNILIILGVVGETDLSNLKPILHNKENILYASLLFSSINVSKAFFLNIIPKRKIISHSTKINYLTYFFSTINLLNMAIASICIFGIELATIYEYPAFQILKRVNILGVINKIESILSIEGIFSIFIEMTIITYYAKEIITQTFKLKEKTNKYISIPICLITLILSNILFQTHEDANSFFTGPLIYMINIICVFIPFLTLLKVYYSKYIKKKYNSPR